LLLDKLRVFMPVSRHRVGEAVVASGVIANANTKNGRNTDAPRRILPDRSQTRRREIHS